MIRLIAFAALAFSSSPDAEPAGHELMVSAWPEPPNVKLVGVHDGVEALACATTEARPPGRQAARPPSPSS